ncbi:hypothetical protein ABIA13_006415 [Sinorhizobium fredii]
MKKRRGTHHQTKRPRKLKLQSKPKHESDVRFSEFGIGAEDREKFKATMPEAST